MSSRTLGNKGFVIDSLEPRRLLSFNSVRVPEPRGWFGDQVDVPNLTISAGNVYVADPGAAQVAKISPQGTVQLFEFKSSVNPTGIVAATDGNVWFLDGGSGRIGRLTPAGRTTFFTLPPDSFGSQQSAYDLVPGGNGGIWFSNQSEIGLITSSGSMKFFPLTDFGGGSPLEFVADSAGNAWFLSGGELGLGDEAPADIGHVSPNGTLQNIPLGDITPYQIAIGPGGNLYFSGDNTLSAVIGSITPTGVVTSAACDFTASQMLTARDGSLWIDTDDGRLVHIATGLQPQVIGMSLFSSPATQATDGNIWFATTDTNQLGRLTAAGNLTEYSIPADGDDPAIESIASDNFGNLWGLSGVSGDIQGLTVFHLNVRTSLLASAPANGISAGPTTQVATFIAGNARAADFVAAVKWPDRTVTIGAIQPMGSGQFRVTAAAGHAMADGSATVSIRDRRDGRAATAVVTVVGNLPTPIGTPINFQATVGVPFTLPIADFTNVLPADASQYTVSINWDDNSNGAPTGIGSADPTLKPDGHGGLQLVGTHVFVAPGTVPVTIYLGSLTNGMDNSVAVTSTISVAPDPNPRDLVINAFTSIAPGGRDGQPVTYDLFGAADISPLAGSGAGQAYISGHITPLNSGATVGQITFTNTQGTIALNLRGNRPKDIFDPTQTWTYQCISATAAYSQLKRITGKVESAFGSLLTGYFFVFHL